MATNSRNQTPDQPGPLSTGIENTAFAEGDRVEIWNCRFDGTRAAIAKSTGTQP